MPEWTTTGAPIQMWSDPTTVTTGTSTIYTTTTPLTYSGSTITTTIPSFVTEYEVKEYCDKVDKHVDQLEEDIDFFNKSREEMTNDIQHLLIKNSELEKQVKTLESLIADLKMDCADLISDINTLKEKVYG